MTFNLKKYSSKEALIIAALTAVSALLILTNLDSCLLWQDEAQTALISRTIVERGIPYGTDGKNYFSQENGNEYGEDFIWKWNTWLPFYFTAASFELFGDNTFAARLPFALFGIACLPMLYLVAFKLTQNKNKALLAAVLLMLNISFILFSRQCRYYSPSAFFTLSTIYFYLSLLEDKRFSGFFCIMSSLLLFHIQFFFLYSTLFSILAHSFFLHRKKFKQTLILVVISLVLTTPWMVWLMDVNYKPTGYFSWKILIVFLLNGRSFLIQIFKYIIPIYCIIPFLLYILVKKNYAGIKRFVLDNLNSLSFIFFSFIITICLLSLTAQASFFRYLSSLLPILLLFLVELIYTAFKNNKLIGLATFILALMPNSYLNYAYELTHEFKGPMDCIVEYINTNCTPNDTILISYGDLPLKYYTKSRIFGSLSNEDYWNVKEPKILIKRKHQITVCDSLLVEYFMKSCDLNKYDTITLNCPDTKFQNRESSFEHYFKTVENEKPVEIFVRKER